MMGAKKPLKIHTLLFRIALRYEAGLVLDDVADTVSLHLEETLHANCPMAMQE
jgi:hypothetical protein